MDRVAYDEFGYFHENAEEFGLPYPGPPIVRREFVAVDDIRRLITEAGREPVERDTLYRRVRRSGSQWEAGEPVTSAAV